MAFIFGKPYSLRKLVVSGGYVNYSVTIPIDVGRKFNDDTKFFISLENNIITFTKSGGEINA